MFDWDDQELSNIIWGETNVTDDSIVPYPEEIDKKDLLDYGDRDRKKLNDEDKNNKASVRNTYASSLLSDGAKQEINGDQAAPSEDIADHHIDLSSFSFSRKDIGIAKKNLLDVAPEMSESQHEDKELGELVGSSWANIGSFDDLDRLLSNDDLDGHTSLGSSDVFWTSSKDIITGPSKSTCQTLDSTNWEFGALGNTSATFETNSENMRDENSFPIISGHQKTGASSSYCEQNVGRGAQPEEYDLGTTGLVKEKDNMSKKKSKHGQQTDKLTDSKLLQDTYDAWLSSVVNVSQSESQCITATVQHCLPSFPSQKQLAQDHSGSIPYPYLSNPYAVPYGSGNLSHQPLALHVPKSANDEYQSMLSNSETCRGDAISSSKPMETSAKPVNMTPQEKIEKLRRRQQMRAMLAIKKQQKQLVHKTSSTEYILSRTTIDDNRITHMKKFGVDADKSLNTYPCYEPFSPNKRDDSSATMDIDHMSAEDTVLYQLQDIIGKLDLKIRLCVRDSLYRLAQSAMQRSYTSDTSSTNRTGTYGSDVAKDEMNNHERFTGKTNVETETNHIDRVVAHLLFHRPLKLSVKHVDTPESSMSTKVLGEKQATAPSCMPVGFLSKSTENEYNPSLDAPKSSRSFMDSGDEDNSNQKRMEQAD